MDTQGTNNLMLSSTCCQKMALQQCDTVANHSATSCLEKQLCSHHDNFANLGVAERKTGKLKAQEVV